MTNFVLGERRIMRGHEIPFLTYFVSAIFAALCVTGWLRRGCWERRSGMKVVEATHFAPSSVG